MRGVPWLLGFGVAEATDGAQSPTRDNGFGTISTGCLDPSVTPISVARAGLSVNLSAFRTIRQLERTRPAARPTRRGGRRGTTTISFRPTHSADWPRASDPGSPDVVLRCPRARLSSTGKIGDGRYPTRGWRALIVFSSVVGQLRSRATIAIRGVSQSRRSPDAWGARRRASRRICTTRRARKPAGQGSLPGGMLAGAAPTPSRARARATATPTARPATTAQSSGGGRAKACWPRCLSGADAVGSCRQPTNGHACTLADGGEALEGLARGGAEVASRGEDVVFCRPISASRPTANAPLRALGRRGLRALLR